MKVVGRDRDRTFSVADLGRRTLLARIVVFLILALYLNFHPLSVSLTAVSVAFLLIVLRVIWPENRDYLDGFSIMVGVGLLPIFGVAPLIGVTTLLIIFTLKDYVLDDARWIDPFFFVVFISIAVQILSFSTLLYADQYLLQQLEIAHFQSQLQLLLLVVIFGAVVAFFASNDRHSGALDGLLLSAFLALVLSGFLEAGIVQFEVSEYWKERHRMTGVFGDPNALGMFAFLFFGVGLFAIQARHRPKLWLLMIMAWGIAAVFSGSRTFALGLGLVGIAHLFARHARWGVVLLVSLIGLSIILSLSHLDALILSSLPDSFQRVLKAGLLENISETFSSRGVFWQIAIAVWEYSPITGAGLDQFRNWVLPVSRSLGIDIGVYTDNPNNFYLGILAELGVIGCVGFIAAFHCMRLQWKYALREQAYVPLVFLILLITGPHVLFPSVAILASMLFGFISLPQRVEYGFGVRYGAVLFLVGLFSVGQSRFEQGFHAWEQAGSGAAHYTFLRWTGPQARGEVGCRKAEGGKLHLRALRGQSVTVVPETGPTKRVFFHADEQVSIDLPCDSDTMSRTKYKLYVDNPWIPREVGLGADKRLLGVQVIEHFPEWRVLDL